MTECQDCGDECKRRKECPRCHLLVCPWCWNHIHALADMSFRPDDGVELVKQEEKPAS